MVILSPRPVRRRPAVRALAAAVGAVVLLLVASAAGVRPASWDPAHMHVVIGGNDADKAHALAAHLALMRLHPETDGLEPPLAHVGHTDRSCADASDAHSTVLSISTGDVVGLAVFGGGGDLVAIQHAIFVAPQAPVGQILALALLVAPDPPLLFPEPPPRAS